MSEYFYVIFQKLCQDIYLLQDPGGFSEQKTTRIFLFVAPLDVTASSQTWH
jgi:hypothetical protein